MYDPHDPLAEVLRRDRRYHRDAYVFVFSALRHAQHMLGFDDEQEEVDRHVSGQQLCEAIRDYALGQYGVLAKNVLQHWGVHATSDFGELVFNLIDAGYMKKTDTDRREDFDGLFDFDEALRDVFQPMASDPSEER